MFGRSLFVLVMLFFVLPILGCAGSSTIRPSAQELSAIRNLSVTVEGKPDFTHTGVMAQESWEMMMLFGLPAVVGDAAVRHGIDEQTAAAIEPKDVLAKVRQDLGSKIAVSLKQSKRFPEVQATASVPQIPASDTILALELANWGTRTAGSVALMPFLELNIALTRQSDRKLLWKDRQIVTGDTRHTFEEYKNQRGLFQQDLALLVDKTSTRVAELLTDSADGSASQGKLGTLPKVRNPSTACDVYVIRQSNLMGAIINYTLALDFQDFLSISSGQYTQLKTDAGLHVLTVKYPRQAFLGTAENSLEFKCEPGKPVYLFVSPGITANIDLLTAEQGAKRVSESNRVELGN